MANYCGLRIKVIVKREYREMIEEIQDFALDWIDGVKDFPIFKSFAESKEVNPIPCDTLSIKPEHWTTRNEVGTDGCICNIDLETGLWTFQIIAPNRTETFEYFLENILPVLITESKYIELYDEIKKESTYFNFVDKQLVAS